MNRKMLSMNNNTSWLLHVTEVLSHRERRQGHTKTHARRLVHLAEHERGLVDDAGLGHLEEEVVALTGALADAGEHRHTTVLGGDTVDHLLDEHRLADAGTAEQADLATLEIRADEVEHLDAGLEDLLLRLDILELRRLAVDRPRGLAELEVRSVEGLAPHVEDVAEGLIADRHRDRGAGVANLGAANETVRRRERDGTHLVIAELLGDLAQDRLGLALRPRGRPRGRS